MFILFISDSTSASFVGVTKNEFTTEVLQGPTDLDVFISFITDFNSSSLVTGTKNEFNT